MLNSHTPALTTLGSLLLAAALGATPARAASTRVDLTNFMYTPAALTIAPGDSVTWSYDGRDGQAGLYGMSTGPGARHNVHFTQDSTKLSGNADGSPSGSAWAKDRTFAEVGTFNYYCDLHGGPDGSGMAGTVTVAEGASAPAAPAPAPRAAAPVLSGRVTGGRSLRLVLKASEATTFKAVLQRRSTRTGRLRRFGTLVLTLRAGTNDLRATRSAQGTRLSAGRYRLIGRAVAGNGQKSKSLTSAFSIRS